MDNPEQHYKYGLFYFNKEDKRIFVPKRIWWTGWIINFANPYSYLVLASISVFIGIISWFYK